ncbi:MAG TPA: DUF4382 domain-containing protein [Pseudoalteromonas prydzensis]|uniref:DUF4382 domain-containing protein n=2 Tax=root TaxID=1 RepID=A0A7V1CXX6_9GAMM|nr:DUF4382 domain-containing protein [Pseudoalteromonas prydzensis]HEA16366.1 DUF4382 domain-containing protein [Pseudoalteromonas prydzensis]
MNIKTTLLSSAILVALTACGGSDNDDSPTTPQSAKFSLGVSDAPVSGLREVNVVFNSITLRQAEVGQDITFATREADDESKPEMVNLLDYTGDENDLTMTSHVVYEDGSIAPLVVKRKGNDGIGEIQLDGFTLNQADNDFVLEFDLKKSLVDPQNSDEIFLKPRGVRLENLAESEDIEGTVSDALIANCETDNIALAAADGSFAHALYLYSSDVAAPLDIYEVNEDETPADAPLATADVVFDSEDNQYEFELAFITPGDYQLAYTCAAHIDDAEIQDEAFTLYQVKPITVTAGDDLDVTFTVSQ